MNLEARLLGLEARLESRTATAALLNAGGGLETTTRLDQLERRLASLETDLRRLERQAESALREAAQARREALAAERSARDALNRTR